MDFPLPEGELLESRAEDDGYGPYGSLRKLGVPSFWGPYNKDPTV